MGDRFTTAGIDVARGDGFSCPAAYFAACLDMCREGLFQACIKEFIGYRWMHGIYDCDF